MAKAGDEVNTISLRDAKRLLVEAFGSPRLAEELLREKLAAGLIPWEHKLVRGGAADPDLWRTDCPEVNFEESSARAMVGVSPSGAPIYGAWHYGITVVLADVRALLPKAEDGVHGVQSHRVVLALKALEDDGIVLADHANLRRMVEKKLGKGLVSRQQIDRVLKKLGLK